MYDSFVPVRRYKAALGLGNRQFIQQFGKHEAIGMKLSPKNRGWLYAAVLSLLIMIGDISYHLIDLNIPRAPKFLAVGDFGF